MAQPPAYNREKNFTLNSGRETDHSALNAELDRASNSINDIRANLAILQADDGKLRPFVVTADSISEELRISLVEGVVMDAQTMLDESKAASEASEASAEKAGESEAAAAASAVAAAVSAEKAAGLAAHVQGRADEIVRTASAQAQTCAAEAAQSAQSAADSATQAQSVCELINDRVGEIVEQAAKAAACSAAEAEQSADEAALYAAVASQRGIPVGTVVMFSASEAPAGYLKCDGAAVGRDTYPDLFAAIGTVFGAGDGETTFNLPDMIGRFAEGSLTPGTVKEAGLPDVTGTIRLSDNSQINAVEADKIATANGAFSRVRTNSPTAYSTASVDVATTNKYDRVDFSLASQNPLYGNSDTVQPPALTLLPCIKAFDAAVNPGLIDVTELANEVTTKTTPAQAANAAMPSSTFVHLSLAASGNDYTAPADGYLSLAKQAGAAGQYVAMYGASGIQSVMWATGASQIFAMIPVKKGNVMKVNYSATGTTDSFVFVYAEGAKP
ncbi:tail fiber protein [Oxalobacter paraformigenes]|uniref:Phage tail collar domain-containing protein n=1 Tax=Oxalobacter paraformigenes TaxID=556268 RepID=C3X3K6_9BURK|nr:tail fiber protein [Oxalobacter paraformigenes]EEO27792.1 hypothetical protein OFAG_00945 [Oxalobacter paraformigenes]